MRFIGIPLETVGARDLREQFTAVAGVGFLRRRPLDLEKASARASRVGVVPETIEVGEIRIGTIHRVSLHRPFVPFAATGRFL